jgi:hypothetical protein
VVLASSYKTAETFTDETKVLLHGLQYDAGGCLFEENPSAFAGSGRRERDRRTDGLAIPSEDNSPHSLVDGERFDRNGRSSSGGGSKLNADASGGVLGEHPENGERSQR